MAPRLGAGDASMDTTVDQSVARAKSIWGGRVPEGGSPSQSITAGCPGAEADLVRRVTSRLPARVASVGGPDADRADYVLGELIGQGGMGRVYAATQTSLERTVAVKILRPELVDDERVRGRFLFEALVAAELEHPNTLPVYDIGATAEGAPFYSMKLVGGSPWSECLAANTLEQNITTLLMVADAVAFAHDKGIIHRDLKPDNVMVGRYGEVLLMDWGLAASVGSPRAHRLGPSTVFAGTPAYMPPEVACCEVDKIGKSSDIYLLGGILYEVVTGLKPHAGSQVYECLGAAMRNFIQPSACSGDLLEIALKAMRTEPEERFHSVQEFQAAIRAYVSHLESFRLANEARRRFQALREVDSRDVYRECNEIIALYLQALTSWPGNLLAAEGLVRTRDTLAGVALKRGEFLLARSQVRAIDEEQKKYNLSAVAPDSIAEQIQRSVAEKDRRR
jgi:serine/threonine protein kinase